MFNEFVDLTHTLEDEIPCFHANWHVPFTIKQLGRIEEVGRETRHISMGTHTGTHMDAPRHFIPNGKTIESIPLSTLCGKVSIIDFSFLEENSAVTIDLLKKIEVTERMLFYFGWSKYWKDTAKFYKAYPYFTEEAVNYLIEKNIKLIGMDTPSPDDSRVKLLSEKDSLIHKLFLKNEVVLVEYLNNLDIALEYNDWNIIALPLKIKEGDGSPSRIILTR